MNLTLNPVKNIIASYKVNTSLLNHYGLFIIILGATENSEIIPQIKIKHPSCIYEGRGDVWGVSFTGYSIQFATSHKAIS